MMKTLQNKKTLPKGRNGNYKKKIPSDHLLNLKKKQSYGFSSKPSCFSNYKNVCKVIYLPCNLQLIKGHCK